ARAYSVVGRRHQATPALKRLDIQLATAGGKYPEFCKPHQLQAKSASGCQHPEAISHAAPEIDGRSFRHVARRARYFADAKTEVHGLRKHLVVKDEIIGVFVQREPL